MSAIVDWSRRMRVALRARWRQWCHAQSVSGIHPKGTEGQWDGWALALVRSPDGVFVHILPPPRWRRPLSPENARQMAEAMQRAAWGAAEWQRTGTLPNPDQPRPEVV